MGIVASWGRPVGVEVKEAVGNLLGVSHRCVGLILVLFLIFLLLVSPSFRILSFWYLGYVWVWV